VDGGRWTLAWPSAASCSSSARSPASQRPAWSARRAQGGGLGVCEGVGESTPEMSPDLGDVPRTSGDVRAHVMSANARGAKGARALRAGAAAQARMPLSPACCDGE
jgi:hypothetical protein